jgi:hypothetical protein
MDKNSVYNKMTTENNEYKYVKSIVAYLDILGFKDMVYNPHNSPKFGVMFNAINEVNKVNLPKMHLKGLEITSISDSIVISVPYKEKASFEKIIRTLFVFERLFMREEVLLRGAITVGDLYHKNRIVFGPALVEAYLLERDCAIYPRCIIKKKTILEGMKTCKSDFGRKEVESCFRQDMDSLFFYDYLKDEFAMQLFEDSGFEKPWQIYDEMQEIKWLIQKYIKKTYSDKITMKYEWLRRYYNCVVLEMDKNPELDCKRFLINEDDDGFNI